LADELLPALEDSVSAAADVLCRDRRELAIAHGQGDRELAIGSALWAHAKGDQVVPIERRKQIGGWNAGIREEVIRFALPVEVRDLVLAVQGRHPVVRKRYPSARVFQRRPDRMLDARRPAGSREVTRVRLLLIDGQVRPEERDTEGTIGSLEGAAQTLLIVD